MFGDVLPLCRAHPFCCPKAARVGVAALRKATHLLGLAIGTRLAQMHEEERSVGSDRWGQACVRVY